MISKNEDLHYSCEVDVPEDSSVGFFVVEFQKIFKVHKRSLSLLRVNPSTVKFAAIFNCRSENFACSKVKTILAFQNVSCEFVLLLRRP
jgi:hypothetical protein